MLILYRKFMFGIYTIYRGKTRLFHRLCGFSIYCWYTKCVSKIYRGYIGMIQIVYRDYIERVSPKGSHILGSILGSMLEGYRCVRFLQGAEMEDGENGAKRLWNGYTREKSSIFLEKNQHFLSVQPFHRRFAPFSPSSISAPYRIVTQLYPSNIKPR